MIPKCIHYCWFGKGQMPELAERCIASWQEHLPEYEIVRWDETNFDIDSNVYVKEAYSVRKYAFVSDYVRLYALFKYGGVYMDTDVEVKKPLDQFLAHDAFSGFEAVDKVPTGIMAAVQGHSAIGDLLAQYDHRHFIMQDSSLDLTTNVEVMTDYFHCRGLVLNDTKQCVCNFMFYPKIVFCPDRSDLLTKEIKSIYTVHHFAGSWLTEKRTSMLEKIFDKAKMEAITLLRALLINTLGRERFERLRGRDK